MRSDLFLFVGILVFLFVVWVASGGPHHPLSFSGPAITPLPSVGEASSANRGTSLSRGPSETTATPRQTASSLAKAQKDIVSLEKSIVSSARFGTPSPYEGEVTIRHNVGALDNTDPDKEYLAISVSSRAQSGIDITGWRLSSAAVGHSSPIPEGVNLPHSGQVNDIEPIILEPGQSAILTTGDSPIGYSFRENMCTGYLAQFQTFTPSLSRSCPSPSDDFARFYLGNEHSLDACKAYVKTIPKCTVPLDPPNDLATDCVRFVYNLNYNGCVATHLGDHGFFGDEWRIFFNRDEDFFTYDHDTIKLLDQNGLTVDMLSY